MPVEHVARDTGVMKKGRRRRAESQSAPSAEISAVHSTRPGWEQKTDLRAMLIIKTNKQINYLIQIN